MKSKVRGDRPLRRSRFTGVRWDWSCNKWKAEINSDGVTHRLGRFGDEVEAARAYDSALIRLGGELAKLNFPQEARDG